MSPTLTDALACSENDSSRSEYVRRLVQSPPPSPYRAPKPNIPRTIIQYWNDLENLPPDVRECIDSWQVLSKGNFKQIVFDDKKARRFIACHFSVRYLKAFDRCYHPAMRCDYFRLCYLFINGGFYVDADELYQGAGVNHFFDNNQLKLQPLCYEVRSDTMIEPARFINQVEDASDWIFYFNNNPIVSPAKHPVLGMALQRATTLLTKSEGQLEIQSTTGPGNLTASVVYYFLSQKVMKPENHLFIIPNWERISISPWPLSYRNDSRNWRIGAKSSETTGGIKHDVNEPY